jgi:hypothetical protein
MEKIHKISTKHIKQIKERLRDTVGLDEERIKVILESFSDISAGVVRISPDYEFEGSDGTVHFPGLYFKPSQKENANNNKPKAYELFREYWNTEGREIYNQGRDKYMVKSSNGE